jgi:hypothetical protein
MAKKKTALTTQPLEPLIYTVRDTPIMLDSDLARIYGVSTGRFNEAFKRNRDRFPEDFAFRLTSEEYEVLVGKARNPSQIVTGSEEQVLISQNATSSALDQETLRSQNATSKTEGEKVERRGGRRYLPWAFTEHGALMAANILRSERATEMSVFIIRAFVKLREQTAANAAMLKRLSEIDSTLLVHGTKLSDLYRKIMPLITTPVPPKRKIGFRRNEEE